MLLGAIEFALTVSKKSQLCMGFCVEQVFAEHWEDRRDYKMTSISGGRVIERAGHLEELSHTFEREKQAAMLQNQWVALVCWCVLPSWYQLDS